MTRDEEHEMGETYDEGQAAGRWSRAVVEAADAEGTRAALPGPAGAWWAAERLNEALGEPLSYGRPPVTATAVGHLVRAGLPAYLGGEMATPDVHPEQTAALARRRDLPALPGRHVPLGPDRAAPRSPCSPLSTPARGGRLAPGARQDCRTYGHAVGRPDRVVRRGGGAPFPAR
ncbi:hypothetical protein ACFUIZ_30670 [Streptomyces cinereoruber]|uniref:hypothetical protein n=1 Tax=Streptomyces cinereoruber TaxID=67260 RepID=UPI0036392D83